MLHKLIGSGDRIVLQGEIIGPGIQGNKYKLSAYTFFAFNLIRDGKKLDTIAMATELQYFGIEPVPILERHYNLPGTIEEVVDYVKGQSVLKDRKREGCVFRNYDRHISFKCINPEFLLEEK